MQTILQKIKEYLPQLNPKYPLKNEVKENLIKLLETFPNDENPLDAEEMDGLIDILKKKKVDMNLKKQIQEKTTSLVEKLETSLVIKPVKPIKKKKIEPIVNELSVEDIANLLDGQIESYNKYDKDHPMLGVTWNEQRKKWRLRYNKIDKYDIEFDKLCNEMQKHVCPENLEKIVKIGTKSYINYKTKNIILYQSLEQPLFDIQHILVLLNLKNSSEKYNEHKDKITHYGFKKNEFDGYILKEFVPEDAMYQIVMSSNSEFSKEFKKNVSKILVELRKNNLLVIKDDKLMIDMKDGKPNYNKKNISDESVVSELNCIVQNNDHPQNYNNPYYNTIVHDLVKNGSNIAWQSYHKEHVMYMFIISLQDPEKHNRIFCKIGYTADIVTRIKDLMESFNCQFYLIGIKRVKSEQFEKDFHRLIKIKSKNLHHQMLINNKGKDEVYIFDEILYKEFEAIVEEPLNRNIPESIIDKYITQMVKDQYSYFLRFLRTQDTMHILNTMTLIPNYNEQHKDTILGFHTANITYTVSELTLRDKDKDREFEQRKSDNETIKLKKLYDHEINKIQHTTEQKKIDLEIEDRKIEQMKLQLELMKQNKY